MIQVDSVYDSRNLGKVGISEKYMTNKNFLIIHSNKG